MRSLICLICLALALTTPLWSQTSPTSEQALQQLKSYLLLIDEGLKMTALPLSEIENSQQQREQRLSETERELDLRDQLLTLKSLRLSERELALNAREEDLNKRENGLSAIQAGLDKLNQDLIDAKKQAATATIVAILAIGTGILISVIN